MSIVENLENVEIQKEKKITDSCFSHTVIPIELVTFKNERAINSSKLGNLLKELQLKERQGGREGGRKRGRLERKKGR